MAKASSKSKAIVKTQESDTEKRLLSVLQNASAISRAMLSNRLGTQFGGERDLYATFGYIYNPGYHDYKNLYDRQGLATRIVEKIASDAWNKPPIIVDGDARSDNMDDKSTPFLKEWVELSERLQIYQIFRQAEIMLGFSRYAVIFMGAAGTDFSQPAGSGGLFYISAFDESQATFGSYIKDMKSEKFGMPEMYAVAFNSVDAGIELPGGNNVHHSRILHISQDRLGSRIYGRPGLQAVINRLFDWEKVTGAGAEVTWLTAWKGMLFAAREGAELPVSGSEEDTKIIDSINAFMHRQQRYAFVTDVDVHDMGGQTVSIKDVCDVLISEIAGAKGYPKRMLLGNEAGDLASTMDKNEYNGVVDSHRTNVSEPEILRPFINWNIINKNITPPASGKFSILWQEVYPMTQREKADYALVVAQGATAVTGGMPEEGIDINEWRALLPLPPRTEQQMQKMEEKKVEEEARTLELEKEKQPVIVGKPGDEEKELSQNILIRALNKLGFMNSTVTVKQQHLGPGDHPSGTSQDVHGRGGDGKEISIPVSLVAKKGKSVISKLPNGVRTKSSELDETTGHGFRWMGEQEIEKFIAGDLRYGGIAENEHEKGIMFANAPGDFFYAGGKKKIYLVEVDVPGIGSGLKAPKGSVGLDSVVGAWVYNPQTKTLENIIKNGSVKQQHLGPGDHPSGSPQSVHGKGGATQRTNPSYISNLTDRILSAGKGGEVGFTYHPTTDEEPTTGVMSSEFPTRNLPVPIEEFNADILSKYIIDNADVLSDPNNYVGAWAQYGKVDLDISRRFEDVPSALSSAEKHFQAGVFNLSEFKTYYVSPMFDENSTEFNQKILDDFRSGKKTVYK